MSVYLLGLGARLEFFVLDLVPDEGVEGGEGLDLGEDLLEVSEAGGVVHEGVDAVFKFDGERVVRGDKVFL